MDGGDNACIPIETENDEDEDEEHMIEDAMPRITKVDIGTINIVPGLNLEEEETPGRLPSSDSRWTIQKSFTNIPLTHRSFAGAKKRL